jgi:hypothetical protein
MGLSGFLGFWVGVMRLRARVIHLFLRESFGKKGGVELEKVASEVVNYSLRDAHVLLHWST